MQSYSKIYKKVKNYFLEDLYLTTIKLLEMSFMNGNNILFQRKIKKNWFNIFKKSMIKEILLIAFKCGEA